MVMKRKNKTKAEARAWAELGRAARKVKRYIRSKRRGVRHAK